MSKNESEKEGGLDPYIFDKSRITGLKKRSRPARRSTFASLMAKLKESKSFYAYLLNRIQHIPDPSIETMAVTINNKMSAYELRYHPTWYQSITGVEAIGVIEHEALHLMLNHVPRCVTLYLDFKSEEDRELLLKVKDIAADAVVNEILFDDKVSLPEGCVRAKDFDLPRISSYETNIRLLMNMYKEGIMSIQQLADKLGKDSKDITDEDIKDFGNGSAK